MNKPTKKTKSTKAIHHKGEFTATEVGTLVERFSSNLKIVAERQEDIIEKLDTTYEQVGKNTEETALLTAAVKDNTGRITSLETAVKDLKEDVRGLKETVKSMAAKIDRLTESIDKLIQTKADREDIIFLDKRVTILETKVAALTK